MDNSDALATSGIQDTDDDQKKKNKKNQAQKTRKKRERRPKHPPLYQKQKNLNTRLNSGARNG